MTVERWTPPDGSSRRASGSRVPGALYGSLLLEQPAHKPLVDAFLAFLEPPGPVALEVGADTFTVLLDQARVFPEVRWVGLEIRRRRVERARPHAPANAWLWAMDARTVLASVVPAGRLSRVDVRFPTPVTDARHLLFTEGFVQDVGRALAPDGVLTVSTDVQGMWEHVRGLLDGWIPASPPPRGEVRSRRERVCRRDGLTVYEGSFTAPSGSG